MKIKCTFLFIFLVLYSYICLSQEVKQNHNDSDPGGTFVKREFSMLDSIISSAMKTKLNFLGIEGGMTFIDGRLSKMDFIRGDIPDYLSGYYVNSLGSNIRNFYAGIKPEVIFCKRFGLSTGLRYMRISSILRYDNYFGSRGKPEYFFVLSHQDGLNTEYLRVISFEQNSDYLNIPFELRFFTNRAFRFRIFIKVGAELNFLAHSETNVEFYDNSMNPYENDVVSKIRKPDFFYSTLNGSSGLRFASKKTKLTASIEWGYSAFLKPSSTGMMESEGGYTFKFIIQLPYNSKIL
jgi:hypothetical protein